ncbi:MAG: hypothetical protein B7Z55_15930, partial [Planctomycetales bacterium 12-60-4]
MRGLSMSDSAVPTEKLTAGRGAWLALIAALLGWMFDGAEMGVFSMVGNAAVQDLLEEVGKQEQAGRWFGIIIATF